MKTKAIFMILGVFLTALMYGQVQNKRYLDENSKDCVYSDAKYYLIETSDKRGEPINKHEFYYMTGELHRISYWSYNVDRNKVKQSNLVKSIEYYKNGGKYLERNFVNQKENGKRFEYHENGKISSIHNYLNNELHEKSFINCDEFGKCQRIFNETFDTKENPNNWTIDTTHSTYWTSIEVKKGLIVETKSDVMLYNSPDEDFYLKNDFSIETSISFLGGEKNSGYGITWGFKDWGNYYYFLISADGYYRIGAKQEGIEFKLTNWKGVKLYNDSSYNQLKIYRVDENIYFVINNSIVYSDNFYSINGTKAGFFVQSGIKKLLYKNFIVKQDSISEDSSNPKQKSILSSWGTQEKAGFFSRNGETTDIFSSSHAWYPIFKWMIIIGYYVLSFFGIIYIISLIIMGIKKIIIFYSNRRKNQ